MEKLVKHMGPVFKQWADQYFESEIADQFEDFKKKNPEESVKCNIEIFKEKLLAYRIYNGHYINTKYLTKDINSILKSSDKPENNKIKLSEKLLGFIEEMQSDEWGNLDCYQSAISDGVCFIGTIVCRMETDEKMQALKHIEALSITRDILEALRG